MKKHDYQEGCQSQNKYGEYVPAIPLPFYLGSWLFGYRYQCLSGLFDRKGTCGRIFKTEEQYRGHYALVHILGS